MRRHTKDPQDVLDYGLKWKDWLKQYDGSTDSILSSAWSYTGPDEALTLDGDYLDDEVTGVWLSGGTVGKTYIVTCHVVTAGSREADRSMAIRIEQK